MYRWTPWVGLPIGGHVPGAILAARPSEFVRDVFGRDSASLGQLRQCGARQAAVSTPQLRRVVGLAAGAGLGSVGEGGRGLHGLGCPHPLHVLKVPHGRCVVLEGPLVLGAQAIGSGRVVAGKAPNWSWATRLIRLLLARAQRDGTVEARVRGVAGMTDRVGHSRGRRCPVFRRGG